MNYNLKYRIIGLKIKPKLILAMIFIGILISSAGYSESKQQSKEKAGEDLLDMIAREVDNILSGRKFKKDTAKIDTIIYDTSTFRGDYSDTTEIITDYSDKDHIIEEPIGYIDFILNYYINLFRQSASHQFSNALLVLILFLGLNMVILMIVMIINRTLRNRNEVKTKELKEKYGEFIFDYVFDEEKKTPIPQSLKDIRSEFKRQVLLDEILHLEANFKGRADVKLRELYIKLGLYKNSLKHVYKKAWYVKALGFRELSRMRMNRFNSEIKKYLNHNNHILRNEAHLALVQMDNRTPFRFLDNFKEKLTVWEQMNIYHLVNYHYLETPEFNHWLDHKNPSVLSFAIKMIGVFEQMKAFPELIRLINHPKGWIRGEIYKTLGALGLTDALPHLIKQFHKETSKNKLRIIKAMQNIPDDSNLEFYVKQLETDIYEFRIETMRAIYLLGDIGIEWLNKMKNSEREDLIPYIYHVLDERI